MDRSFLEIMNDSFRKVFRRALKEKDIDIEEELDSFTEDALCAIADEVHKELEEDYDEILGEYREMEERFQERLYEKWKEPLDRLELLIYLSRELGGGLQEEYQDEEELSYMNEALSLLHGRARQISQEILHMLKGGYADAALARWRALHETTVKMFFIKKHGDETAKRFLQHRTIEDYKLAKTQRRYSEELGHKKISDENFKELKDRVNELIEKYGKEFKSANGWAAHVLENVYFKSMEEEVQLDKYHPYYKFACSYVHSGPKGAMFKLGDFTPQKSVLTSASNYGLADPGQMTSLSLEQANSAIVSNNPSTGAIIMLKVCQKITKNVPELFANIQKKMEEEIGFQ